MRRGLEFRLEPASVGLTWFLKRLVGPGTQQIPRLPHTFRPTELDLACRSVMTKEKPLMLVSA